MKKSNFTRPAPPPPFALVAAAVVVIIEIAVICRYYSRFFSFSSGENPKTQASVHYYIGKRLLAQEKHQEAKPKFQQALKLSPDYSQAYINLGVCYFQEGNYEAAEKSFKTALTKIDKDVHKNIPVIYHNLGSVYVELGEFGLAWDYYMKGYKGDPTCFDRDKEQWLMLLLEQNNKEKFISRKQKGECK